jgi:hypothetical protein
MYCAEYRSIEIGFAKVQSTQSDNSQDNRAESWSAPVVGYETCQGQTAYCNPHARIPGLSGSPSPARSEGQKKQRAAKFLVAVDKLSTRPVGPIFEPIADELNRLSRPGSPGNDSPETFAAIGSTLDKTNSQMTSLAKTINKHFAVQSRSKIRTSSPS